MSLIKAKRHAGFTLIELVIAIVIISVGVAGVMAAFSTSVRGSGDRLVDKQMLAVAEEMMEEVLLKPFAITGAAPSNSNQSCQGSSTNSAAARNAFNDVRDYNGYSTTGICDAEGNAMPWLNAYNVAVTAQTLAGTWNNIPGTAVLQVNVTVTHGTQSITLTGFRTNYGALP
jgi:MSHA pilin protein MshD